MLSLGPPPPTFKKAFDVYVDFVQLTSLSVLMELRPHLNRGTPLYKALFIPCG